MLIGTLSTSEAQQATTPPAISPARQIPLSGREAQPGGVGSTLSTTPSPGVEGALVTRGTVTVEGAYQGSVPSGDNTGTILPLRLDYALQLALRQNLGALTEANAVRQAEGARMVARSSLLPDINSVISETTEQLNLRTQGVETSAFPLAVGPFNYFDARAARVTQAVVDLVRWRNLRTASENVKATILAAHDARDLIVLAVAGSYLEVVATEARMAAAQAQVHTSEAVYQQAVDRLKEGLNARIDTTRTHVQLQIDQLRLRSLQADRDRQKLRLARLIGLPLGQDFSLADDFPYAPLSNPKLDEALANAFRTRADLQAAQAGVRAAGSAVSAARAERLPNLSLMADYGASGLRPTAYAHGVFTVVGTLTIPLYQGGRVRGEVEQAEAALHQRQAEASDIRGRVDQDVRQAFIDIGAAADQVDVARSNIELAEDTLRQSRDRFLDGIADTIEVVQAQQSAIAAHDDYINAVFDHNLAKVALARAIGDAEHSLQQYLIRK
ncbi:MAG: TolC family protein [Ignavibacteriota bacterium]